VADREPGPVPVEAGRVAEPGQVGEAGQIAEPGHVGEAGQVGEQPPHRPRRGFVSRHLVGVIVAGIVVVLLGFLGGGWLWYDNAQAGSPGAGVIVTVTSGESFDSVRSQLTHAGVIDSDIAFDLYMLFHGTPDVQPGRYYLRKDDSFSNVLGVLDSPPNVLTLQVPPGFTVAEISARLQAAGAVDLGTAFQALATSGSVTSPFSPAGSKNLDGLLAAGSYQVLPTESANTLLQQMIAGFTAKAAAAGLKPGVALNGLDAYQVVTVASIVEKEGVIEKNMGKVSRVIYNRLAGHVPLQMDSTVLYSLGQDGGPVTPADLQLKSPYNTYLNAGLTPTPICFPSDDAIDAAVHPTAGHWLYFTLVSQDGTEAFSDTYAGQEANERLAKSRGLP
jgi:peptidoglycan lytic transglycosylase G